MNFNYFKGFALLALLCLCSTLMAQTNTITFSAPVANGDNYEIQVFCESSSSTIPDFIDFSVIFENAVSIISASPAGNGSSANPTASSVRFSGPPNNWVAGPNLLGTIVFEMPNTGCVTAKETGGFNFVRYSPMDTRLAQYEESSPQCRFSGKVELPVNEDVRTRFVRLFSDGMLNAGDLSTDPSGEYSININSPISPKLDAFENSYDKFNGNIDIGDVVAINRHILGIAPFSSSYQLIAGDANGDGKVRNSDITVLINGILGVSSSGMPRAWAYPTSMALAAFDPFNDYYPSQTYSISEEYTYDASLSGSSLDFTAVKFGDPLIQSPIYGDAYDKGGQSKKTLSIPVVDIQANTSTNLPVYLKNVKELEALSLAMTSLLPGLKITGVKPGSVNIEEDGNYIINPETGMLNLIWVNTTDNYALSTEAPLFYLSVVSQKSIKNAKNIIEVTSDRVTSHIFHAGDSGKSVNSKNPIEATELVLDWVDESESLGLTINLVSGNPIRDQILLSITSRTDDEVTVELIDISGKALAEKTVLLTSGVSLSVNFSSLSASLPKGTYIYRATTADGQGRCVGKLIK